MGKSVAAQPVGLCEGASQGAHPLAARHRGIDAAGAHAERHRHELADVPLHRGLRHGDDSRSWVISSLRNDR